MQIEYLTDQQIVSWGTVFEYDSRDNLLANSNINSFVTDNKVMAGFAIRNNVFIKSIVNVGTGRHKYQ